MDKALEQKQNYFKPSFSPQPPSDISWNHLPPPSMYATVVGLKDGFQVAHEAFRGKAEVMGKK